ncbi:MAG TPA: ABC transporter permease [Flavitalea sp.]|nr:ABC transporter permease [Flavitalea sp.]
MMFKNYLKIALRNIWKDKMLSAINILGLSLGIACALIIIFHVKEEVSYDKSFPHSDRIFRVTQEGLGDDTRHWAATAPPLATSLKQGFHEIEQSARLHKPYPYQVFSYTPANGETKRFEEKGGFFADSNLLDIFNLEFVTGDPKTSLSQKDAIILTEKTAKRYFGDENPIGRIITDQSRQYPLTVTGVVKDFSNPTHLQFDYLLSMSTIQHYQDQESLERLTWNGFYTYVLLKDKHQKTAVESRFPEFILKFYAPTGQTKQEILSSRKLHLQPITDIHLHSKLEKEMGANSDITYVYIFSVAAFFILLIASVNFVNIFTAHALKRIKEVGVRKVIGATRIQVITQFLGEAFLITTLATFVGLLLFKISIPFYNEITGKEFDIQELITLPYLGIIAILVILIALSAGFFPAWFIGNFKTINSLKGQKNTAAPVNIIRKSLIVFQFVVAVFMIFSTIVIYRQMRLFHNKDLGFDKEQVLAVTMYQEMWKSFEPLVNFIGQNKNISSFATTSTLPGERFSMQSFETVGTGAAAGIEESVRIVWSDDRMLATLGIPLRTGRNFTNQFPNIKSHEFIINETAVKALHLSSPIGARVVLDRDTGNIVGVVNDFNFASLHAQVEPLVIQYNPFQANYLLIKVKGEGIKQVLQYMESKVKQISPSSQFTYVFIDDKLNRLYEAENRMGEIFKAFAGFAILISCLGLFGLSAYSAQLRVKEVGIRKVLGASISNVTFLLTSEFVRLVILATVISWPLAWWIMSSWLHGFAFRTTIDIWIFVYSGAFAILVAFLTVSIQAIKAAMANPVKSLKAD